MPADNKSTIASTVALYIYCSLFFILISGTLFILMSLVSAQHYPFIVALSLIFELLFIIFNRFLPYVKNRNDIYVTFERLALLNLIIYVTINFNTLFKSFL